MPTRAKKITFGQMRASGVHGILIYCADYRCSHQTAALADGWPDDVRQNRGNLGHAGRAVLRRMAEFATLNQVKLCHRIACGPFDLSGLFPR